MEVVLIKETIRSRVVGCGLYRVESKVREKKRKKGKKQPTFLFSIQPLGPTQNKPATGNPRPSNNLIKKNK
jgi:hypothetical protein